jgi:hypothetical protein
VQPNLDVHRHSDGTIDFDFYRRRASRLRRLYKGLIVKQWLAQVTAIALLALSTAKRLSCAGERRLDALFHLSPLGRGRHA